MTNGENIPKTDEMLIPLIFLKIYLFLAVLGLCCCTQAFSSCGKQGLLSSCSTQASLVEHRF